MENLYNVDSPIDRVRRKNLNDTFADILRRFNNLQMQINILSGDSSVEDVLTELTKAIDNANVTIEDIQAMAELYETKLTEIEAVITNANNATSETIGAIDDAREAIVDINNLIASMRYKGEYDSSITYYPNNIVRYGKNSYVSLKEQQNVLPDDDGVNWQLIAMGGTDGTGAVSTVNDIEPDGNGNVVLKSSDIGAASVIDLATTSESLGRLEMVLTQHMENFVDVKSFGAKGDGSTDDTIAFQDAISSMANRGGKILIPQGNFLITSTLVIPPSVSLQGAGMFNTMLSTNVEGLLMFSSEYGVDTGVNISVSDLGILCNAENVQGFKFVFCNRVSLSDIIFYGCKVNAEFDRGGLNRLNNLVSAGTSTLKSGSIRLWSSDDTKFGCTFTTLSNYRIENNGQGVQSPALYMRRAVGVRCDNIITNDSDYTGICILLENDCQGITVENSIIVGYGVGVAFQQGNGVANAPVFCTFSNVDFDQCAISSIVVTEGGWLHFDGGHITSSRIAEDSKAINVSSKKSQWIRFTSLQIGGYRGNGGTAILLNDTDYVSVTDCLVDECNQGIALLGTNTHMQIKDNTVLRTDYPIVGNPSNGENIIKDNYGIDGTSKIPSPALPASDVGIKNNFGYPVRIYIYGGNVSLIKINDQGAGFTNGFVLLMPNETLKIVYTVAPNWNWIGI